MGLDADNRLCRECGLLLPLCDFSVKPNGYVFPRCKTCMRGAGRIDKACRNCGTAFPATTKSKKMYCSVECKKTYDALIASNQRSEQSLLRGSKRGLEVQRNQSENPQVFELYRKLPVTRIDALEIESIQYFTGLKCINGHLAPKYTKNRLCFSCLEERRVESEARRKADGRYAEQKIRSNARNRQRRSEDEEYRLSRLKSAREWQSLNRPHLAAYMQRQRDENPQFLIQQRLQTRLNRVLKRVGTKRAHAMDRYLECTSEELAQHLERQFGDTMSWEKKGEWHVDHIRPCSSFDLTKEEQIHVCFNWRNLQPMNGRENQSKQDKYDCGDEVVWVERMKELGFEGKLFLRFS